MTSSTKGFLFVFLAAFFWSTLGITMRFLNGENFTSFDVVAVRIVGAGICLVPLFISHFQEIKLLPLKTHLLLFLYSVTGVILFYAIELKSFEINPTGIAYVILYSSPIFVVLSDSLFFKNRLTKSKIISLVLIISGIILITGLFGNLSLSFIGLLTAIGSAIFYASYSVWGKYFNDQHLKSELVVSYIFIISAILMLNFLPIQKMGNSLSASTIFSMLYIGIFPTAISYLLYQKSLKFISISQAGITATVEPIFALVWGITILGENISGIQLTGIVLILAAIVLLKFRE